jgi:hypothetical protein
MTKSLAEIFVLAACGEFASLEGADDLVRLVPSGRTGEGSDGSSGPVENATGLFEIQETLIEKRLQQCGGNGASGESVTVGEIGKSVVSHDDLPENGSIIPIKSALSSI